MWLTCAGTADVAISMDGKVIQTVVKGFVVLWKNSSSSP